MYTAMLSSLYTLATLPHFALSPFHFLVLLAWLSYFPR
jgi:hypothetical protein